MFLHFFWFSDVNFCVFLVEVSKMHQGLVLEVIRHEKVVG